MQLPADYYDPSPGPWEFHTFRNGLNHVVYDRLGHHLCSHIRHGDGALIAGAPAMRDLLIDLLAGADVDHLSARASIILAEIATARPREPGEDDE
jgi:hypothetical protein